MEKLEIINAFILGATNGEASNLEISGDCLINYSTIIARRKAGMIYLNIQKYSKTTSKNQTYLKICIPAHRLVEVNEQEINRL